MEFPKSERHLSGVGVRTAKRIVLLGVSPRMVVVAVRAIASKGPQVLVKHKPRSGNVLVRSTRFLQQKHEPGSGPKREAVQRGRSIG